MEIMKTIELIPFNTWRTLSDSTLDTQPNINTV